MRNRPTDCKSKSEKTAMEARLRDDAHPLLTTGLVDRFDLACLQDG